MQGMGPIYLCLEGFFEHSTYNNTPLFIFCSFQYFIWWYLEFWIQLLCGLREAPRLFYNYANNKICWCQILYIYELPSDPCDYERFVYDFDDAKSNYSIDAYISLVYVRWVIPVKKKKKHRIKKTVSKNFKKIDKWFFRVKYK